MTHAEYELKAVVAAIAAVAGGIEAQQALIQLAVLAVTRANGPIPSGCLDSSCSRSRGRAAVSERHQDLDATENGRARGGFEGTGSC